MATNTDIREWGKLHAPELFKPKGPPSNQLRDAYNEQHPVDPDQMVFDSMDGMSGGIADPESLPAELPPLVDGGPARELPPGTNRRRSFTDWLNHKKPKAPRASVRGGPRASTAKLAAGVWGIAAKLLNGTAATPLSRVLALQAPVAGMIIDREIKGTLVDVLAQPVARLVNRASQVGVLFTLPILVQVVTMRPDLYEQLRPHMVDALYDWFEVAGPEIEKMAKRQEKRRQQFNGGEGPTPEQLIELFFMVDPDAEPQGSGREFAATQSA